MAGKPELSVAQQTQQAPGVQNVVVYVSNENIAQAYATAVGGHQHLEIPHQNGLVYTGNNTSHHVATKSYKQNQLKPSDVGNSEVRTTNSVLDVGGGCFYQTNTSPQQILTSGPPQANGFLTQYHHPNQTSAAVITPSNFGGATALKNVIGFNSGTGEVYATTSTNVRSDIVKRDDVSVAASSSYVATGDGSGAFVTVMGADVARDVTSVGGSRCDSVRSDAAESSCSSLSSGDSINSDPGRRGLVLLSTTNPPHPTSDNLSQSTPVATQPPNNSDVAVVYDTNSLSIGGNCGQQPLVLAMAPPGTVFQQQAQPFSVIIPLGWKRIINNNVVIYISPSNIPLSSMEQIKEYLLTQGTCKCGLECPLKCDVVFNFDPKVAGKPWTLTPDTNIGDLTKLCNHKRKLLAMNSSNNNSNNINNSNSCNISNTQGKPLAAVTAVVGGSTVTNNNNNNHNIHNGDGSGSNNGNGNNGGSASSSMISTVMPSTTTAPVNTVAATNSVDPNKLRKDVNLKRKKRKVGGPYSGVSVSQLLAQREKVQLSQQQQHSNSNHPHQQPQIVQSNVQQVWAGINNTQTVQIHQQQQIQQQHHQQQMQQQQQLQQQQQNQQQNGNRISGFIDQTTGQIIRYQNQQINNRQFPNTSIATGTTAINGGGNTTMMIQHHQQQQSQPQNQQQIIMQQNNQQQILTSNQNMITGPNGQQFLSIQPHQQPQNQQQIVSTSMMNHHVVNQQQQQGQGALIQQQRIVLNNQQSTDEIQDTHSNITLNVSSGGIPTGVSHSDIIQRLQNQQHHAFNHQQQSIQIGQNRSDDQQQIKIISQQSDQINKNLRNYLPQSNNNAPQQMYNNFRSDNNQHQIISNHQVILPQHKTPPWQQNKINQQHANNAQQQQSMQQQTLMQQNIIVNNNQSLLAANQQQSMQPQQQPGNNIYERVPPLHHHTPPPPIWNDDSNRKTKTKVCKTMRKSRPYNTVDHHRLSNQSEIACPNIDVRQISSDHHARNIQQIQQPSSSPSGPSFMEDPSGYLAQQTALLNSTISRQTGIHNGNMNYMCNSPGSSPQSSQQHVIPTSTPPSGGIPISVQNTMKSVQCYSSRSSSNMPASNNKSQTSQMYKNEVGNQSGSFNSSNMTQKTQCQGCVTTSQIDNNQHYNANKNVVKPYSHSRPNSQPGTPNNITLSREDSPVTSSTFSERFNNSAHQQSPDTRPIQGGTISTSNGSPTDMYQPQPEPSPSSTVQQIRSSSTPNTFVSSSQSSQFVTPSHNSPVLYGINSSMNRGDSYLSSSQSGSPITESITVSVSIQNNPTSQSKHIDGYCPHPHAAGGTLDLPNIPRTVTTMASGRTFGSNTITSVLAGRAQTATVSVNTPAIVPALAVAPLSHTSTNTNQHNSQQMVPIQKSPLEMVQSVVSSIQVPQSQHQTTINTISINTNQQPISPGQQVVKQSPSQGLPAGHILVSSGGQIIMANNGQGNIMPPPPPKIVTNAGGMPPISVSPLGTNVSASVTQVIPNVGMAQQVLGQQTVLVNTLPTPFVIQPGVMTVDGMTVGQNMQLPQLVTGNVIQQQIQIDNNSEHGRNQGFVNRQSQLISPDSGKRKGKKRKNGPQTVASMLHVAAQHNSSVVIPQQQGFQTQSFQMAHSPQGVNSSVLQALTIVPGKGGAPPQIVMNGQPSAPGPFSQQIITGSQPTQQINLLQPVNLLNGTTGMVQNFPTIQQFIVPGLGGMVMTTDGSGTATLLPDTPSVGMQLQLQNVNGQNVLTPVQNTGTTVYGTAGGQSILAAGPAGMVIRSPGGSQGKIIQQQHSPGAQFLSPNGGQFVVNGAQFNGQLSPLVASVSPSQQVTVRPASSVQHTQHEFIQCGQMGQTLMVPCTPNNAQTIAVSSASGQQNTTFVQQNTTIVQQQTTMLSNNQQIQNFQSANPNNVQNATQNISGTTTTLNVDQNFIMNNNNGQNNEKQQTATVLQQSQQSMSAALLMQRHSVSTQTAVGQSPTVGTTVSAGAGSPPDTTTHSPLALGADTTTHEGTSPSPPSITRDHRQITHSMAMVHCISSSEPDVNDLQTQVSGSQDPSDWNGSNSTGSATPKPVDCTDYIMMTSNQHLMHGGGGQIRKSLTPTYVESTMSIMNDIMKPQEAVVSSQRNPKRKHSDTLAVLETRHIHTSLQDIDHDDSRSNPSSPVNFSPGELVWGPAHGCPAWPGKLVDGPKETNGRLWVRWFGGDKVPTAVDPVLLQTLTQGLDAHHRARKNCRKSRKLNTQLENAIQEAMVELDRMTGVQQQSSKKSLKIMNDVTTENLTKKEIAGRLRSSQK